MNARRLRRECWRYFACWSLVLLWALPIDARPVAVVRPVGSNADLTETVTRLHGELLAVGLEVAVVRRTQSSPRGSHESLFLPPESDGEYDAVLDIVGATAPFAVDVWVIDQASEPALVSRVEVEPGTEDAPEKLAIRAIDVLRSTFLVNAMAAEHQPAEVPPPEPPRPREPIVSPRDEERGAWNSGARVGVAGGVAALTSFDGVGPAIMPTVRVDVALSPEVALQAAIAGLGSRPMVASNAASAQLSQHYAVIGARHRFRSSEQLQPFVGLSAGVLHTAVEGQAEPPRSAHDEDQWSLLVEGSAGADLQLLERYYLSLAAHAHLAEPSVAVHVLDSVLATTGRPNLALTLTVGAWL